MNKNKKNLFFTLAAACIILLVSGLTLFGGFRLIQSIPSESAVTSEVQSAPIVVNLDTLEESTAISNKELNASPKTKSGSLAVETFKLDNVVFEIREDLSPFPESELTANDAAKIALDELKLRFPKRELENTLYITRTADSWYISSPPTNVYSYPTVVSIDAISGKIYTCIIPYKDPVANTQSDEPWISNRMLGKILNDTFWSTIAYKYLRENFATDKATYFSDTECDLSYSPLGIVRVSCLMKSGHVSTQANIFIDIKTSDIIGYAW